jgi:hypothetical protein
VSEADAMSNAPRHHRGDKKNIVSVLLKNDHPNLQKFQLLNRFLCLLEKIMLSACSFCLAPLKKLPSGGLSV